MVGAYFVDAWLFIATLNRFDAHHRQTRQLMLKVQGARLVTHTAIFHEVLAYFGDEGSAARGRAVEAVRLALRDMIVIDADRDLFMRAVDRYAARPDKEYSLADCMSMVVMRDRGLTHVLTNDHHFRQEGFTIVNE